MGNHELHQTEETVQLIEHNQINVSTSGDSHLFVERDS